MVIRGISVHDWFYNQVDELNVAPMGDRYYKIARCTEVEVSTDEGNLRYKFQPGFVTNFRSGGLFVDRFVDQIGDNLATQVSWLVHDANYTPCAQQGGAHPVSKELADDMLKAMLTHAGMKGWKASIVCASVRAFGRSAYEEDDELTTTNSNLFEFHWDATPRRSAQ